MARRAFPHCPTRPIPHDANTPWGPTDLLLILLLFFLLPFLLWCQFCFFLLFSFAFVFFSCIAHDYSSFFNLYPTPYKPDRGATRLPMEPRAKRDTCPACYEDQRGKRLAAPISNRPQPSAAQKDKSLFRISGLTAPFLPYSSASALRAQLIFPGHHAWDHYGYTSIMVLTIVDNCPLWSHEKQNKTLRRNCGRTPP